MADVMAGPGWYIVETGNNVKEGPFPLKDEADQAAKGYLLISVKVLWWDGKVWSSTPPSLH